METLHLQWYVGFILLVLVSLHLLRRALTLPVALAVVGIKFGLLFIYAFAVGLHYAHLDDLTYLENASSLLVEGWSTTQLLFSDEGLSHLFAVSGGIHVVYSLWNFWAMSWFGESYFSPVLVNVFLTVPTGLLLYHWARQLGFSRFYARGLCLVFSLHWELLPWSSFLNLKDVLILFLEAVSLYGLWRFAAIKQGYLTLLLPAGGALFVLSFLRFYVPVFVVAAFGIWIFLMGRLAAKRVVVLAVGVLMIWPLVITGVGYDIPDVSIPSVLLGIVHFLMTPRPWSVDEGYSFLMVPAMIHWLLLPVVLLAAFQLWRHRGLRLLLIYLGIMLLFYGSYEELQGPRHRVQILFVFAWLQWHGVYLLLRQVTNHGRANSDVGSTSYDRKAAASVALSPGGIAG